jgi:hypothetical protein
MMIIACLLFPETPTVTQGEVKGNSWCEGKHKTGNFSNIQSIKCRIVYTYWLGMRLIAPLLSPRYQLLAEAIPRKIVGTEGTISVNVKCNRSTLNQNLIASVYILNQMIQVTPKIDWCNKVKGIQDIKQCSHHLGKKQFVPMFIVSLVLQLFDFNGFLCYGW